jgi:phosphoserine aminotransferase
MARAFNFNAGPAALPLAALERAQAEFLDIGGTGMSIMEHSHRGKFYEGIHNEAVALVKEIIGFGDTHEVLFLQGGASQQFALVPMNLLGPGKSADYVITGAWSQKALSEGKKTGVGTLRVAATTEKDKKFTRVPGQSELELDPKAEYVHITSNNTIFGTQFHAFPDTGSVPLVADMSSDIMWKPLDVAKFGLIYAGAQKNLGPSGVTLVIIRKDMLEKASTSLPGIFQYKQHAENNSMLNTCPTFGIYMLRNVLLWIKETGGLQAIEKKNREKAELLYKAIDARPDMFKCPVEKDSRSYMNVVFTLPNAELETEFLAEAKKRKMEGLKGHRSVGGMRASIYNAAPIEWVQGLVDLMNDFHKGA